MSSTWRWTSERNSRDIFTTPSCINTHNCRYEFQVQEAHQIVGQSKSPFHLAWKCDSFEVASATEQPQNQIIFNGVLRMAQCRATWTMCNKPPAIFVLSGVAFRLSPENCECKMWPTVACRLKISECINKWFGHCELSCSYDTAWDMSWQFLLVCLSNL